MDLEEDAFPSDARDLRDEVWFCRGRGRVKAHRCGDPAFPSPSSGGTRET